MAVGPIGNKMKLLYENDLIYGRLLLVNQSYLVDRYRKAMKGFGLKATELDEFHIDMTGFSPEIAEEMDDQNYLDPLGVNRRFIILSPDQEHLPVVHTKFSNTGWLMHQFFNDNGRALRAVTIKDALYGEIDDPIARVEDIDDLLSIEEVKFEVKSADSLLDNANELRSLVDHLNVSKTAWRDDDILNRMVKLAAKTGDIRNNELVPQHLVFDQGSYWANHFGGVFVFRDERTTTIICDSKAPGFRRSRPWQVSYLDIDDHDRIFDYLKSTNRLQLPTKKWIKTSKLLEHRAEMVIRDILRSEGEDITFDDLSDSHIRSWLRGNNRKIARDGRYGYYQDMLDKIDDVGKLSPKDINKSEWLLLCRANPKHNEKWLVNRLVSRLTPFDFVSRFVFDKQGFYEVYQNYSDEFKQQVVSKLKNTYLSDKQELRSRLYQTEGGYSHA